METNKEISVAELISGRHCEKSLPERITAYKCTAYFRGKDGQGTCSTGCQHWDDKTECPCAEGSPFYDGLVS